MFGMERLQDELSSLNREKAIAAEEMDKARAALADRNKEIQDLDGEIEAINAEKAHLQNISRMRLTAAAKSLGVPVRK